MPRRVKRHKEREPQHTYLCPDSIYIAAQMAAEDNDEPLSEAIRRALVRYVKATGRRTGKDYFASAQ